MKHSFYSSGIVLDAAPKYDKIAILDQQRGRIDVYPRTYQGSSSSRMPSFITGSLVDWGGWEKTNNTYMTSCELVALPALPATDDLFFVHHVCELCRTHLSPSQGAYDIYPLLLLLYDKRPKKLEQENMPLFKKIFLYNLISLLGLHPEGIDSLFDSSPFSLISHPGNSMFDFQDIRSYGHLEKKLTVWLYEALHQAHIQSPLKTFSFINRLGVTL